MISIILPIKNRAQYFWSTLESYVRQSLPSSEFELIVVDQQSDDGLLDTLKRYHNRLNITLYDLDPMSGRVKPMKLGLINPSLPQNFGVKNCNGDIIILTSPETVFAVDNLKLIKERVSNNNFIYGRVTNAKHYTFKNFEYNYLRSIDGKLFCGKERSPEVAPNAYFIGAMMKQDFIKIGGVEEAFMVGVGHEDDEFGRRLKNAGLDIKLDEEILGIHQFHGKIDEKRKIDFPRTRKALRLNESIYNIIGASNKVANSGREWGIADAKICFESKVKNMNKKSISSFFADTLAERLSTKFMEWLEDHQEEVIPPMPKPTRAQKVFKKQANNVMLHCNQVFWRGGTNLAMRDMAAAYPEFHHVNIYFYDSNANYEMMAEFEMAGIDLAHAPKLTEELVKEVDPTIIVFHNTPGELVEGEWPYDWLKQWPIIAFHHNKSFPAFHANLDLFVSTSVLKYYEKQKPRMNWKLVPPCMDLRPYGALKRSKHNTRCVIGKLTSNHPTRYPPKLLDILGRVQDQVPEVEFILVGGADHWKDVKLKNCKMPATGSMLPQSFYNDYDIFVHKNTDNCIDSWGRTVSEAMASGLPVVVENRGGPKEQVDHKENGFLCDTDEQFVEYLVMLAKDPVLRYEIGMKAREKALREFGIDRLRRETQEVVLKAALGVI